MKSEIKCVAEIDAPWIETNGKKPENLPEFFWLHTIGFDCADLSDKHDCELDWSITDYYMPIIEPEIPK